VLAALDSQRPPGGPALLAFVENELRAALPLDGRPVIADPFKPTEQLIGLLKLRAAQSTRRAHPRIRMAVFRPKAA
jgi:hypothetical protein